VCDGQGRPVHLHLTAGNIADITQAQICLAPYVRSGTVIIADRGYDADHLREWLASCQATACIPPRKNRKIQYEYDKALYKSRNIIERLFGRFKDWRQLSLRTFRCPKTFLAAAHLAAIVIHYL
jgi:transposase